MGQKEKLYSVTRRPHPPPLLSPEKQNHIKKNIKTYTKKYDAIDDQEKEKARNKFRKEREEKINAFRSVLDRLEAYKERLEEESPDWKEGWEEMEESKAWEETTSTFEEELGVTEELIDGS